MPAFHPTRKAIAIPLAAIALAVAPAGASAVADVIKSTNNNRFDKATYSSDEGDLVQFQHTGGGPHDVTSTQFSGGTRLFSSATISSGTTPVNGTQSLAPGTYPFFCTVHSSQMTAELVVRSGGPPPPDGSPPPDDGSPPPDDGSPSNEFSFGKVKKNKKKGTAKLTVIVPGPGELELAKTKKVKGTETLAAGPGEVKLPIKPRGEAKEKLAEKGAAKVKASVTYTPEGGEPNTQSTRLKLIKRR